ncbi:hypothetical protein [Saccharomonospora glauca]|jgi:hypothetical protein|uniref:Uncharacterized protein n=1 Tax=Saccharomonospora glauca K62 TaxID=928724 RepID=I1D196_9PSEU|nr:hypothetical protein [Saccharomonospora glauca]EIE98720.1 hypothetical protein SacglDRAFT_01809 [Saccharomonospora glauca K62]
MTHTSQPDTATVRAVGKLTEALEAVEEARGHLYAFHRLTGTADFALEEAIGMLRDAGHTELATRLDRELLGRNVLPGRWTYQVVEDYEDTYYGVFRDFADEARKLTAGQRHAYEASLKRDRRTPGLPGHEAEPRDVVGAEDTRTATDRAVSPNVSG